MRFVCRHGHVLLLRLRWKHRSVLLIGGLLVTAACIAEHWCDLHSFFQFSSSGTVTRQEVSAVRSRRLSFYPPDYVIGRWNETNGERRETFDKVTIRDPRYPNEHKTKEKWLGLYKEAPIGRKFCIVLHIIGIAYMLMGLNTVCDIYFCGALDEMVEQWEVQPDVAGATFMAAGGSAPELFTSIIAAVGVENDVGFSTIVGSAVFNVLAVIGCCGMAAKEPIKLTWWPLFRDCTFYITSLSVLAIFADGPSYGGDAGDKYGPEGQLCDADDSEKKCGGGKIKLYEAIILFLMYILYCILMVFNEKIQARVQGWVSGVTGKQESTAKVEPAEEVHKDALSVVPGNGNGNGHANGHEVQSSGLEDEVTEVTEVTELKEVREVKPPSSLPPAMTFGATASEHQHRHHGDPDYIKEHHLRRVHHKRTHIAHGRASMFHRSMTHHGSVSTNHGSVSKAGSVIDVSVQKPTVRCKSEPAVPPDDITKSAVEPKTDAVDGQEVDKEESVSSQATDDIEALMTVPEDFGEKALWVLCLPIYVPMYYLIPRPESRFILTFFISLLFIAAYSYTLVYCVQMFSDTILGGGNNVEVIMGFTLLAAGTSIPDLVSSMAVARAGQGDMAISSSIGSNIFDILVGLPIPWILKIAVVENGIEGNPDYPGVTINSPYISIYVYLLLFMVTCVVVSILVNKWFLNRTLGIMMAGLYVLFLGIVIPLELSQFI